MLNEADGVTCTHACRHATLQAPTPGAPPLPCVCACMQVDKDPRCAIFRQMRAGLFVRMALLAMCLGKA